MWLKKEDLINSAEIKPKINLLCGDDKNVMAKCERIFPDGFFSFSVSTDSHFSEIDRFLDESMANTRFRNYYTGNVVLDLSEWNKNCEFGEQFNAFMYFIKDNTDKYNCVFIIDSFCTYEFITKLKDFFEIEQISLGFSKTFQKVKMGFTVSDGTKEENNVRS